MHKNRGLICLALLLALILGPGASGLADQPAGVAAYFPIRPNARYVYEGTGNEYASYDVFVDYAQDTKMQQRVDNGGTVLARVVEVKEGAAKIVYTREEAYYRENFLNKEPNADEILLMEPLVEGTRWALADGRERRIASVSAPVSTPSGDYTAVEVVTASENGTTADYYAMGVGLVKSVFRYGDFEVISALAAVEEDAELVRTIRFFYPDANGETVKSAEAPVRFRTNDITRTALERAYRAASPFPVFSENTRINSLYLNRDGMAYIDLNRAFLDDMNAGSGIEALILQSVANTFGQYYGVERVLLTIDDELYESGHIALRKGEYLKVRPEGGL
ncbi:MAG: GerMN domain-containing protein [Clostridiales bacterium]|nr:GerMN domain-containing protein [Clostridiales bacterium]